jgi:hypothetical protein
LFLDEQTPLDRLVSASFDPVVQTVMVVGGSFLIARALLNTDRRWWFATAGILILAPLAFRNLYIDRYRARRLRDMRDRVAVVERINDIFLDVPEDMDPPGGPSWQSDLA